MGGKYYVEFRGVRIETKKLVKKAKENSWKDYGELLTQFCHKSSCHGVKSYSLKNKLFNPT